MVYESGICQVYDMNQLTFILTMCTWMVPAQTQSQVKYQDQYRTNPQLSNPDVITFREYTPYFDNLNKKNRATTQIIDTESWHFPTSDDPRRTVENNFNQRPPEANRNRVASANVTDRSATRLPSGSQTAHKPIDPKSLAVTNFSINLLKNVDQQATNVVISPLSVATVLALLQQGALGSTQQQISQALQMPPDESLNAFKAFTDAIQKRNSRNVLKVANNVYMADVFRLNPVFRNAVNQLNSEVTPIRFDRPDLVSNEINNWVASRTENNIQDLLKSDAVDENSQIILVNAVYFKGLWQSKFKKELTHFDEFHLFNRSIKRVQFMRIRRIFKTGFDRAINAQIMILPFENDQYSLMIVLPAIESSLNNLIDSLTGDQLAGYQLFTAKEVELVVPKFTIRGDTELTRVLKQMGVTDVFSGVANLSNIGNYRSISPQVSAALHTAMLSIDEDGGTASAATAFAVVALSYNDPSLVLRVNRPFLAVLWDNESALPLFMAKIDDPSK